MLLSSVLEGVVHFFIRTRVLWLPAAFFFVFWKLWLYYIRSKFLRNINWTLFEIKLPREIAKSPQAMEVVLNSIYITKDGNLIEKYWQGFLRPWFSLEIVGINSEVRFFVYTWKIYKNLIENQIYSQYPDVEIADVDDYSKLSFPIEDFNKEWGCFGTEYALTAEDPYPIKTYIDYGLHQTMTKEEQKIDPLTSLIEVMGSLKEGEQLWMQILIKATAKKWKDEGKKVVEKIIKEKEGGSGKDKVDMGAFKLSPGERLVIEAIERDVSKLGFDIGIRQIYLARNDRFSAVNIPSMIAAMRQYNAVNLNGFRPARATSLDYPWQFKKLREPGMKRRMVEAYRSRSYFYMNWFSGRLPFVLNTEELATIFHFPGRVAETPTFGRIEARKSEAPPNLPI